MLPYHVDIIACSFYVKLYDFIAKHTTAARVISIPIGVADGVSSALFAVASIIEALAFAVINAFGVMFCAKSCSCRNILESYFVIKAALVNIIISPFNAVEMLFYSLFRPDLCGKLAKHYQKERHKMENALKIGTPCYGIDNIRDSEDEDDVPAPAQT